MKYKAILFDMNGVLVDDEHLQEEAFRQTLAKLNVPLSAEDYITFFIGKTDRKGFEDYLQSLHIVHDTSSLIQQKGKEYENLAFGGIQGYPGVKEFVEAAVQKDLRLAVVTSSMKNEAVSVLAGLGLTDFFSAIVAADDVKNGKPDPEGYLKGAAALAVDPKECIVIEDAPSGIEAARSAGMACVAVVNTHAANKLSAADMITEELSVALIDELAQ